MALELGAFFGRMMVPIDFEPGVEQAISAATPLERYAAFVAFEQARYAGARAAPGGAAGDRIGLRGGGSPAGERGAGELGGGNRLLSRMGLAPAG